MPFKEGNSHHLKTRPDVSERNKLLKKQGVGLSVWIRFENETVSQEFKKLIKNNLVDDQFLEKLREILNVE